MQINHIQHIGEQALIFTKAVQEDAPSLLNAITQITNISPFRAMQTPYGIMKVKMTNCGAVGWISDSKGYRYSKIDPLTGNLWPKMPKFMAQLATKAAKLAGFSNFAPNVCLINQYQAGDKLALHTDKDEGDFSSPIVSFSLGASAIFRLGGLKRKDLSQDFVLNHGDIMVWGGVDRLRYHAISKIYATDLLSFSNKRFALTFRYTTLWS